MREYSFVDDLSIGKNSTKSIERWRQRAGKHKFRAFFWKGAADRVGSVENVSRVARIFTDVARETGGEFSTHTPDEPGAADQKDSAIPLDLKIWNKWKVPQILNN